MSLVLPALMLGSSLLSGFFGHKSKEKQAKAQKAAQDKQYADAKAAWDANERNRVQSVRNRADLGGSILSGLQGSLQPGAPNYTLDPSMVQRLGTSEARPFAGTVPTDPTAGMGSSLASGFFGGASQALQDILMGQLLKKGSSPAPSGAGADWTQNVGQASAGAPAGAAGAAAAPSSTAGADLNLCQSYPYLPGCPGGMSAGGGY